MVLTATLGYDALKPSEIRRLLNAIAAYSLMTVQTNKGRRNAKKNPQARPAKLKPATVARLQLRGKERRLLLPDRAADGAVRQPL
ncbi:MAG TPA: hypothetical protein VNK04_20135 [Gemmataceae bacterium]|nr:hypothetical protein [Gemmataceae bacterium]